MPQEDTQEIIKIFLKNNMQLTPESVSFFKNNLEKIEIFLSEIKNQKEKQTTIDLNYIRNVLEKNSKVNIKILKTFNFGGKTYSVEDAISFIKNRYETFRKILTQRIDLMNLISINRISEKLKTFSLIAMIVEKGENEIFVEDTTGEVKLKVDDKIKNEFNFLIEDEVIGLICENKNDEFYITKIIWPDIPLAKTVKKTKEEIYCLFLSNILPQNLNEEFFQTIDKLKNKFQNKNFLVFLTNQEEFEKLFNMFPHEWKIIFQGETTRKNVLIIPDPCIVDVNGIFIFISSGKFFDNLFKRLNVDPEIFISSLLKKRHLHPTVEKNFTSDVYFLDIIPDIFVIGYFQKPRTMNYKGTTIISNGSFLTQPIYQIINLRTRENIKVEFT